jgi:hypothetical protein
MQMQPTLFLKGRIMWFNKVFAGTIYQFRNPLILFAFCLFQLYFFSVPSTKDKAFFASLVPSKYGK